MGKTVGYSGCNPPLQVAECLRGPKRAGCTNCPRNLRGFVVLPEKRNRKED